jgi:hypothetical protein
MIALLATLGIGGGLGVAIGVLNNPYAFKAIKYSYAALKLMSQGKHLSKEDKEFIREYNSPSVIIDEHDYTEQLKIANLMRNW